jgi:hypothetical protein
MHPLKLAEVGSATDAQSPEFGGQCKFRTCETLLRQGLTQGGQHVVDVKLVCGGLHRG